MVGEIPNNNDQCSWDPFIKMECLRKCLFQWMSMFIMPQHTSDIKPPVNTKASKSSNFELKRKDIAKLKVAKLRTELGKCDLWKNDPRRSYRTNKLKELRISLSPSR